MERLLRQGAYALVEEDGENSAFCEEDIDQILSSRSRKVRSKESAREGASARL